MKNIFIILFFFSLHLSGQDKLFLKNGKLKEGTVISIGTDYIFFKNNDTSLVTYKIPKNIVSMIEKYDGKIFIYSEKTQADSISSPLKNIKRNSFGIQPFNILTGRFTFVYEHLNKEGTIGFCPVLSLSFDPVGTIYTAKKDSSIGKLNHRGGINFIGGGDINFYLGKKERSHFFIGPRVRYGVDMFAGNTEAYSIQTQFGWRLGNFASRISQHLSFGFGFVRILSLQGLNGINPKQSYGWGSINYRVGFNW
ncbi:MAG: hypothetical protein ACXVO9_13855 [Bacteroidia bacterium]